ncbi:MAG: hypothetical protein ABIN11_02320 [candidate division WOR-3 bacterium]
MFSKFIHVILVTTSLSPVLLTLWFKSFSKSWNFREGILYFILAIILLFILKLIIDLAKIKLEIIPVSIKEISIADNESVIFIFTYLIPLLGIEIHMVLFLLVLFFIIVLTINIYHFNPLLSLLGYHQYEIKLVEGSTFILITRKMLINSKQIKNVVQLTNYILLEKE